MRSVGVRPLSTFIFAAVFSPLLVNAQIVPIVPPPSLPVAIITGTAITSSNASTTLAKVGDTVTLSFTSSLTPLSTPTVTIAGRSATVVADAGNTWSGAITMLSTDTEGTLTYSVVVGNLTGTATTTVNGTANGSFVIFDKTSPTITLNGADTVTLTVGDTFTDPGASAFDAHDGSDTVVTTGSVDTSTAGVYTLTYSATDAAGNIALSATRTVTVNAAPAPPPAPPAAPPSSSSSDGGGGGGNGPIAGSLTVPLAPLSPVPEASPPSSPSVTVAPPIEPPPVQETPPTIPVQVITEIAAPVAQITPPAPVISTPQPAPKKSAAQTSAASTAIGFPADWLLVFLLLCLLGSVGWWIGDSYKAQAKYGTN